jgi:hypothetical protein
MLKTAFLVALGAVALALPAAAQPAYSLYGARAYDAQYYAPREYAPRGDYDDRRVRFGGYPAFRGLEAHIRGEIADGVRNDLIERDDARDLMNQLRDIQRQEAREFRVHGWTLPNDDRYRIRSQLKQLDQLVDQVRDEP